MWAQRGKWNLPTFLWECMSAMWAQRGKWNLPTFIWKCNECNVSTAWKVKFANFFMRVQWVQCEHSVEIELQSHARCPLSGHQIFAGSSFVPFTFPTWSQALHLLPYCKHSRPASSSLMQTLPSRIFFLNANTHVPHASPLPLSTQALVRWINAHTRQGGQRVVTPVLPAKEILMLMASTHCNSMASTCTLIWDFDAHGKHSLQLNGKHMHLELRFWCSWQALIATQWRAHAPWFEILMLMASTHCNSMASTCTLNWDFDALGKHSLQLNGEHMHLELRCWCSRQAHAPWIEISPGHGGRRAAEARATAGQGHGWGPELAACASTGEC